MTAGDLVDAGSGCRHAAGKHAHGVNLDDRDVSFSLI
jgi:hypothetical protein